MLPSFSIALKDVFNDEFPPESITKSLRRELVTNHGFYQQFSIDSIDALVELENGWTWKILDNPLGYDKEDTSDLFLLALGNTFKVNVIVFQSHTDVSVKHRKMLACWFKQKFFWFTIIIFWEDIVNSHWSHNKE